MADRTDSIPTLKTINVPTQIIAGEEDALATLADAEAMKAHILAQALPSFRKRDTMRLGRGLKR